MTLSIISNNPEETKKLGKDLAKKLQGGEIISLIGDLGSGKTTFVQGAAEEFKIKEKIKSPTFVILKKYKINNNKKLNSFFHIDLYRLGEIKSSEMLPFDIKEISNKKSIAFIEWGEKILPLLPKNIIKTKFEYINKNRRKIIIS